MASRLLQGVKAPALPTVPNDYVPGFFNRFNDVLRLYFNRIDATVAALLDVTGGSLLNNPYGTFSNNAIQTLGAANTATRVTIASTTATNGVTLASNTISCDIDGVYNVSCRFQLSNSSVAMQDGAFWLRKNGADVVGSAVIFTVPDLHVAVNGRLVLVLDVQVTMAATDSLELYWAATNTAVTLYYEAAQGAPYARPSVPSTSVVVTFISAV